MSLLFHPAFWLGIVAVHLVLAMCPPRFKSAAFGVLNGMLLLVLVGAKALLAVAILAVLLWGSLRLLPIRRGETSIGSSIAPLIASLGLAFLVYKVLRDHPDAAAWAAGVIPALPIDGVLAACAAVSFSYVFLRAVDVALAVSSADAALMDPVSLSGYLAPFHMLAAGPIANYREHASIARTGGAPQSFAALVEGVDEVVTGLFYKFVIAESLKLYAFGARQGLAAPTSLADTMFLLVYVFFDFAGYSRIALGIGRITGVPTPRNFNAPFAAQSVTDFWTRWHMSLGAFVSRNIYTPLQLRLVRRLGISYAHRANLATLLVAFAFVGIWHRVSVGFLAWGLTMGAIMFVEKVVRDRYLGSGLLQNRYGPAMLRVIGPVYVFVVISVSLRFVMREFLGV